MISESDYRKRMDHLAEVEAQRLFNAYVEEWERKRNIELNRLLLEAAESGRKRGDVCRMTCSGCRGSVSMSYPWEYRCPHCGHRFGS